MRAIVAEKRLHRMLAVKGLKRLWPGVVWSPISHVRTLDIPEPELPGPRWLRVKNRQCGICATDLTMLNLDLDISIAPAALPGVSRFYLGHEVVGEVVEVGEGVRRFGVGDRVVIESRFDSDNCEAQEIDPLCKFCAAGQKRLCENASLGLGPEGYGGGWGDGYTAHETEVWGVPDDLDDDQASLVEPMAVALHAVLRRPPQVEDRVLVVGAGIMGLLTTQMVKIVEPGCHLTVVARHSHQAEAAIRLGADEVIRGSENYEEIAQLIGAKSYEAPLNRGMLLGGFEVIYDCVGSRDTLFDALRLARAGGTVVLVGLTVEQVALDVSPIWFQEVDLVGARTFGMEEWRGRKAHTFDLVIEMLQEGVLKHEGLITHRFPFEQYREAIATATNKRNGSIKVMLTYS